MSNSKRLFFPVAAVGIALLVILQLRTSSIPRSLFIGSDSIIQEERRVLTAESSVATTDTNTDTDSEKAPKLLSDVANLQESLSRLNRLLQNANINPDDELMTHASKIVEKVRHLVQAEKVQTFKTSLQTATEERRARRTTREERQARRVAARRQEQRALRGADEVGNINGSVTATQELELEVETAVADLTMAGADDRFSAREARADIMKRNLFEATIYFPECKELLVEDCHAVLDAELAVLGKSDATRITHEKRNKDQSGYNKVVIITDLTATAVKGKANDGKVHYDFLWNDGVGPGRMLNDNGVWDCHALEPSQCCALIQASAPNPDKNGNHLECHIFVPFGGVGNPKTNERVFINLSLDGRVQEAPFLA